MHNKNIMQYITFFICSLTLVHTPSRMLQQQQWQALRQILFVAYTDCLTAVICRLVIKQPVLSIVTNPRRSGHKHHIWLINCTHMDLCCASHCPVLCLYDAVLLQWKKNREWSSLNKWLCCESDALLGENVCRWMQV